jgi:hypothetical protein
MMATMPTTSAIAEERFLSEVSSKLDEITYVFAPKLPGSPYPKLPSLLQAWMLRQWPSFVPKNVIHAFAFGTLERFNLVWKLQMSS